MDFFIVWERLKKLSCGRRVNIIKCLAHCCTVYIVCTGSHAFLNTCISFAFFRVLSTKWFSTIAMILEWIGI